MRVNNQARKLVTIFLVLLLAVFFVNWFDQKQKNIEIGYSLNHVSMDIDGWKGTNLPTSEKEKNWIEQGDLIMRCYQKNNNIVYLVAIQEKGDRHKVHSPADCYSGSGWVILRKDSISISDNNINYKIVRRMHVVKENNPRLLYYWFTNGEERCTSFKEHLVLFIKDVFINSSLKSWVCFQISADIKNSVDETDIILKDFIFSLEKNNSNKEQQIQFPEKIKIFND